MIEIEKLKKDVQELKEIIENLVDSNNKVCDIIDKDQWMKREENRIVDIVYNKIIDNVENVVGEAMKKSIGIIQEKSGTPVV